MKERDIHPSSEQQTTNAYLRDTTRALVSMQIGVQLLNTKLPSFNRPFILYHLEGEEHSIDVDYRQDSEGGRLIIVRQVAERDNIHEIWFGLPMNTRPFSPSELEPGWMHPEETLDPKRISYTTPDVFSIMTSRYEDRRQRLQDIDPKLEIEIPRDQMDNPNSQHIKNGILTTEAAEIIRKFAIVVQRVTALLTPDGEINWDIVNSRGTHVKGEPIPPLDIDEIPNSMQA